MRVRRAWRTVRAPAEFVLAGAAMRVAGRLPYRWIPSVARAGALVGSLHRRHRRVALANLRIAFPDWSPARQYRVFRSAAVHLLRTPLEVLWYGNTPEALRRNLCFETPEWEAVRSLAKSGRPCIFLTAHLGNWELLGHAACLAGIPLCAVARRIRNPWVDRLVTRSRTAHGLQIIPEKGAAKKLLRALRNGRHAGILMDQNIRIRRGGVFVDFFGLPAPTTRAPAALARKLDAHVLAAALVRDERTGGYSFVLEPLEQSAADFSDDISLTQAMLRLNERLIRRFPEQYLWHYERWRYIPGDASPELRARFPFYAKFGE